MSAVFSNLLIDAYTKVTAEGEKAALLGSQLHINYSAEMHVRRRLEAMCPDTRLDAEHSHFQPTFHLLSKSGVAGSGTGLVGSATPRTRSRLVHAARCR